MSLIKRICINDLQLRAGKGALENTSPVSDFGFFFMSLTYKRFVFYVVLAMALAGVE